MFDAILQVLGLRELLPEGPACSPWARFERWPPEHPAEADYLAPPRIDFPVLPVLGFGVRYHLDLVLVSKHPQWHMHEYALLQTPAGPRWLAKDARASTRNQSIIAGIPEIEEWFPELPIERRFCPIKVADRSTEDRLDIDLSYTNLDGEAVSVSYQGPPPRSAQTKRNGCTMGHSRKQLMAALDISHRSFAHRARISVGHRRYPIRRILGLVPFQMVLNQTQGGLSAGHYFQVPDSGSEAGFHSVHEMHSGRQNAVHWTVRATGAGTRIYTQESPIRALHYHFLAPTDQTLELTSITATQWGDATPTFHMSLSPALPDLRRRFSGKARARYVIDINGQPGHALGHFVAHWEGDSVHLDLVPEAPWWTADRPMQSRILFTDEKSVEVRIESVSQEPPGA